MVFGLCGPSLGSRSVKERLGACHEDGEDDKGEDKGRDGGEDEDDVEEDDQEEGEDNGDMFVLTTPGADLWILRGCSDRHQELRWRFRSCRGVAPVRADSST